VKQRAGPALANTARPTENCPGRRSDIPAAMAGPSKPSAGHVTGALATEGEERPLFQDVPKLPFFVTGTWAPL
jgi:hypothetical protein